MEFVSNKYDVLGFIPFVGSVSGIVGLVKETKRYKHIKETNKNIDNAVEDKFSEEQPLRLSPKNSKDRIIRRSFEIVPILGPIVWTIGFLAKKLISAISGLKEKAPTPPPRKETLYRLERKPALTDPTEDTLPLSVPPKPTNPPPPPPPPPRNTQPQPRRNTPPPPPPPREDLPYDEIPAPRNV